MKKQRNSAKTLHEAVVSRENGSRLILSPSEHAQLLHGQDKARGYVFVAYVEGGRWREQAVKVTDIPCVVEEFAGRADVYLTQNRFYGCKRRIVWLGQLGANFIDLDYHKTEYAGHNPYTVLERAFDILMERQIPPPTFVVFSGRGLQLVWLHTPVPRKALPRWNAVQAELCASLEELGADYAARDATRVLRLVDTVNSRCGKRVFGEVISGHIWSFDRLADEVLPLTRAEVHDLRIRRALKGKRVVVPPGDFSAATLWEARLSDLMKLLELRGQKQLPPGQRDCWLFLAGVAMSWLAVSFESYYRELVTLASMVGSWTERESRQRFHALYKRLRMYFAGQKVEYNGMLIDPRYRFRNETIIEWLKITPEEQRQLSTIWSEEVRREKDRRQHEEARREVGMMPREEYLAWAEEKEQEARKLREQGLSVREIAELMGLSERHVRRLLDDQN
ncbi:helix-turn-helix domain-containing protein [Ammonifex thiophilus]|uniref:Sigma-70 family RNA polymerase sigma factor n=1 Tax=Ammonifex thiophilus TaxID=444093 RepID=A0A3D8P0K8_9THEO|nr:helix-turn-helix domain-containing protein [Ammonifex thiophilus]RDV80404.1 sigma-70 family RNA polymerase sigma factor [Ammonifex thiophilus]